MKGLSFEKFETFVSELAPFGYAVKCYMMQKPVPGISDEEAVRDIWQAIDYFLYYLAVELYYHQTTPVDKLESHEKHNLLIIKGYEAKRLEPMIGFEPMTCSLRMSCSTN